MGKGELSHEPHRLHFKNDTCVLGKCCLLDVYFCVLKNVCLLFPVLWLHFFWCSHVERLNMHYVITYATYTFSSFWSPYPCHPSSTLLKMFKVPFSFSFVIFYFFCFVCYNKTDPFTASKVELQSFQASTKTVLTPCYEMHVSRSLMVSCRIEIFG